MGVGLVGFSSWFLLGFGDKAGLVYQNIGKI